MKSLKKIAALSLCAALLLPAFGCAAPYPVSTPAPSQTAGDVPASTPAAPPASTPESKPAGAPVNILKLSAAPLLQSNYGDAQSDLNTGAFGFRLANKLYQPGENMVASPYSVWLTLAALTNATDKSVLPQLMKALGAENMSEDDLNKAVSRALYDLTGNEGKGDNAYNPLSIANAVFVDKNEALQKAFAQKFLDYFRGAAMNVDFDDPSAIAAINAWAKEQTKGLIPEIVKDIPKGTVAAIANAIYFSDRWEWEFDEAQTVQKPFHGAKSDAQAMFMLHEGDALSYYEDGSVQGIDLPFKTGGGLYILLPKDGDAGKLLGSLTAERFTKILENTGHSTGKLLLPRFSLDSSYTLNDSLKALGVPLFDPDHPELTGLVESMPAFISSALHKATIKVDEKGTTAAAVTVMMAAGAAMPVPTKPFSMVCDHPFVFVLHRHAGAAEQPLFVGVVNQL